MIALLIFFDVAVCVKFLNRFIESLDEATKSTPAKIEDAFRKFCKNAKRDDNRFVSLIFLSYTNNKCYIHLVMSMRCIKV